MFVVIVYCIKISIPISEKCFTSIVYYSTNVKEPGEIHPPSANLNAAFKYIKDIQKKFKDKENEEKEKADLVQQDKLIMSQGMLKLFSSLNFWFHEILNSNPPY